LAGPYIAAAYVICLVESLDKAPVSSTSGAVAGGVVGGLLAVALTAGLVFLFLLKNEKKRQNRILDSPDVEGTSNNLQFN